MKSKLVIAVVVIACLAAIYSFQKTKGDVLWTKDQLMEPKDLAALIQNKSANTPIIFNIGPAGKIPGAIYIGPAQETNNLATLKKHLEKLPKNANVVIYCGCCPFEPCPNIRPAFKLLTEMGFSNRKLLNLSHNLKMDWIDKGYPVE